MRQITYKTESGQEIDYWVVDSVEDLEKYIKDVHVPKWDKQIEDIVEANNSFFERSVPGLVSNLLDFSNAKTPEELWEHIHDMAEEIFTNIRKYLAGGDIVYINTEGGFCTNLES